MMSEGSPQARTEPEAGSRHVPGGLLPLAVGLGSVPCSRHRSPLPPVSWPGCARALVSREKAPAGLACHCSLSK